MWYDIIRHSVDMKIMCRFPKLAFKVKAQQLYHEYILCCLNLGDPPDNVNITDRWVADWLWDNRLTHRQPNRKWKVSRRVLAERLKIFWITIYKLRKLILLEKGYDPQMRNLDQSPFHMNEAGSQVVGTIAMKGAPIIPLLENHGATRERWSLSSMTDSNKERINSGQLPGFECMFKATGNIKAQRLQDHADRLGCGFKVSVVTGPSGSYREDDIIKFLEKWCEPWYKGRQWEFIMLDAYAPGLTDNVQRLCWKRGYIVVTHGGGASMICQTNDVGLHKDVRADFIAKQTEKLLEHARSKGGGLCDLTAEENISLMCEVMSNPALHQKAADSYKWTGTTNALDGSEDELIAGDARQFWDELEMRKEVD